MPCQTPQFMPWIAKWLLQGVHSADPSTVRCMHAPLGYAKTLVPVVPCQACLGAGKTERQAGPALFFPGRCTRQQPRAAGCGRGALHCRCLVWSGRQPTRSGRFAEAPGPGLDRYCLYSLHPLYLLHTCMVFLLSPRLGCLMILEDVAPDQPYRARQLPVDCL